jgi:hypothetical protein
LSEEKTVAEVYVDILSDISYKETDGNLQTSGCDGVQFYPVTLHTGFVFCEISLSETLLHSLLIAHNNNEAVIYKQVKIKVCSCLYLGKQAICTQCHCPWVFTAGVQCTTPDFRDELH